MAGLGIFAMADGISKGVSDAGRLENPSNSGNPVGGGPKIKKTNGRPDGDKDLIREWESDGVTYQMKTGHGFNRAQSGGTDLRTTNLTPDQVEQSIISDIEGYRSTGGTQSRAGC